jgi:long-chain acyl-CoA synthetase
MRLVDAMLTLVDPLRRARRLYAAAEAVVCDDVRLSYAELGQRVDAVAAALRSGGLEPGDRVALLAANCHRYLELLLAVPGAGIVLVPLNTRLSPAELRHVLTDSGTRVLITDREPGALAELVEHVVEIPAGYEQLVRDSGRVVAFDPNAQPTENELAVLSYTGGTTGDSKGVMLTHRNLIANAFSYLVTMAPAPQARFGLLSPMFHVAGVFALPATVWSGGTHVVVRQTDAPAVLDLFAAERVSATLAVPTVLATLAEEQSARPRPLSALRDLVHAAAPCPTSTVRSAHEAFPELRITHMYGATETAPIVTALVGEQDLLDTPLAGSCGPAVIGVELRVSVGDSPASGTTVGELEVRGPNVMPGYWRKDAETAAAFTPDGWYRTGDVGYLDGTGHLFLVDRLKDMIVTGGENVYCGEVEEALTRHPAVRQAVVFGVPDDHWGEAVHAVVVPADVAVDAAALGAELQQHCRASIAGYKVPKSITVRTEPLPVSAAGKILRRVLREPHWAGLAERVH